MLPQDDSFPRGGVKPKRVKADTPKEINLFNTFTDKKKEKAKRAKAKSAEKILNNIESGNEQIHSLAANVLSYKGIIDGMLILGCVRKIKSLTIEVELPGRVYGEVWIKSISERYYKELNRKLNEEVQDELNNLNKIFTVGQFIPVKVINVNGSDNHDKILLSTNPADINSSLQHKHLEKGVLLWGAIAEKSDHCYFVDVGVMDSRVVLPFTKVDPNIEYDIGQPFYSVVMKCNSSNVASTITVSALQEDIDKNMENKNKNLDHLIPGMQVNFNIIKILRNGLEGNILNNCVSYINQMYLTEPCGNLNKFNIGSNLMARILYIQPTTKFVFLTLRNLATVPAPKLSIGVNEQATVIKKIGSGLLLKFKNNEKGFVTLNRIIKTINDHKIDVTQVINNKYITGTSHRCRILDYNKMDRIFICSFESEELNKKILSKSDVKHAQIVEGIISQINDHGIVVQIENVTGFIPNIHTSNSAFSKNIKNKYKEGQKIKAKVWYIDPNTDSVKLTIKQDLLNSRDDLLDYESVKLNQTYTGVVMTITNGGALVVFFGGVKGWLPSRNIPHFDSSSNKAFFIGQVVKCNVQQIKENRITLTLDQETVQSADLKIGDPIISAKIKHLNEEGLFLTIDATNTSGFLPWAQFYHPNLSEHAMSVYENGDAINDLTCVNNKSPITLSVSNKEVFKSIKHTLPEFKSKCSGTIVKAYFLKKLNDGIKIVVPLKEFSSQFFIKNEEIIDNDLLSEIKFKPYQEILVKILPGTGAKGNLVFTSKLSQVFNYDYNRTLNLLEKYLTDLEKLSDLAQAKNNILGKIKIGQKVKCVVKDFNPETGCELSLRSGKVEGFADIMHCSGELEKNSKHDGIVLWIDYKLNKVILSLKPEIIEKVKNHSDEEPTINVTGNNIFVQILYVNDDCAVAIINCKEYRGQIIFLPVRLHENDFLPNTNYYQTLIFDKVKAVLHRNYNGKLLGVEKSIQKMLTASHKLFGKKLKRKAANEEAETPVSKKSKLKKDVDENDKQTSDSKKNKKKLMEKQIEKNSLNHNNEDKSNKKTKRKLKEENESSVSQENSNILIQSDTIISKAKKAKKVKESNGKILKDVEKSNPKSKNATNLDEDHDVSGPVLPGIGSFFNAPETKTENNIDSDDNDDEDLKKKKKKKLTQAEKAELIHKEEERLRKIEAELADSSNIPQTAEHFDRALLGNPDNSEIWLRYIAFHIQSTELDKARSVAKRALDKISYTLTQERLNVWLAYLNLENMYGSIESFENIFAEAIKCNDSLTVHLEAIKMLAEMQKYAEMEEKIKKARLKFKQETKMWLEIGRIYYKCKRFVDARKVKDAALKTLLNKKEHINLIVKFALMEMTLGEEAHGETLFETILQSDPKRVDVWSTYVDQLIKNNKIDIARNVLMRAVGQKLPYKKMKTLFKKYLAFENTHGDNESVENVKEMLKEYVS